MPLQKISSFALAVTFITIVALGCSRHPELAKTNEKGASEWKRRQTKIVGQPDLIILTINAANRIDTPAGEKFVQFGLSCGGYKPFSVLVATGAEAENGDVKIGFDGAALAQKKWDVKSAKDHPVNGMELPEADESDFLRQLRHAGTFQFEFTPKGGKPQMSTF